ncbi:alpha/beta fold hydrolase [Humidisolicoccus flavus]|uniref:alpha/beta fold hydrolase n=1 Tax=Humidisolicoccus flavus TaxID=3111414 RepID=UPI0032470C76
MRLHSTTLGSGPLHIGLVHGLGAESSTWQPLIERMLASGRCTITSLDLRGHGKSERAKSYSLSEFADDVVENLPKGLHAVVGHSLGGAVLVRAVDRLQPHHAIYLDPGFELSLPTAGAAGRAFWAVPALTLGVVGALQARRSSKQRAAYPPAVQKSLRRGKSQFDAKMAIGVFKEVAFNPVTLGPPAVPSTIVLSEESPAILSDRTAAALEQQGWEIRRFPGVHHDMHLEDPERTFEIIDELL